MVKSKVILVLSILFLISSASAAWEINDLDEPYSQDQISHGNQTVQLIEILDNDDNPVNKSYLEDSNNNIEFIYNTTEDTMNHLTEGYWYAKFDAINESPSDRTIEYELESGLTEINKTEILTSGNLTMNLETDLERRFKTEDSVTVEVEVIDAFSDVVESDASVDMYFTNGSWTSDSVELGYNSNKEAYTNVVDIPNKHNASYVSVINAAVTGASYDNSVGSIASITETYPDEVGEITELSTDDSGCNNESFFHQCERDTNIDVGFNVSVFSSSRTDLELYKVDESNGNWVEHDIKSMTKNDGIWETNFDYPDINTSEYDSKLVMRVNSTIDGSIFTLTRNISSESYKIRDKSEPTAYLGDDYRIKASFAKFFSLEPINGSRIDEANFTINKPNGSLLTNFTLEETEYKDNSGLFINSIDIPVDADNGSYSTEIEAENLFGERKTLNSGFTVKDIQSSFNVTDSIDMDINKTKMYNTTVTLSGKSESDKVVTVELNDSIENITTVNEDDPIFVNGTETVETEVEFNISYVEDYSGGITFKDEDLQYNTTLDVELDAPDCDLREGVLCIDEDSWINHSSSERGYTTEYVTLTYLGDESGEFVSTDVTGNISDYLSLDPREFTAMDEHEIELNYSSESKGNFTGDINFTADNDFLTLKTNFESKVENLSPEISVSGSTELGEIESGSDAILSLDIENTGDVQVDSISASSLSYTVSTFPITIPVGDTSTVDLEFRSITSSSGDVDIEASTSEGTAVETIAVSAQITESVNYEERLSELTNRINELSNRASTGSSVTSEIENLRLELSEIRSLYEEGSTEEANSMYRRINNDLDTVEQEIESSSSPGQDPRQQEQNDTTTPPNPPNQDEGGSIVIPLIVVLLVILVSGFVVYTSYIPEEGDPLYSVLGGEEQS